MGRRHTSAGSSITCARTGEEGGRAGGKKQVDFDALHKTCITYLPALPPSLPLSPCPSLPPSLCSIRGIMLWNASDYLERAREVINAQPNIHNVDMLKRQIALAPDAWLRVLETSAD